MSEPTAALDFSIFDAPAGADVLAEAPEPQEVSRVAPTAVAESEVETPEGEEVQPEDGTTVQPKQIALTDDDLIPIKQDGKTVYVRWGDYNGNVMRMADYTRKTTAVASREKEIEGIATTLAEREQELLTIVRDRSKLEALYTKLHGQPLPAGQPAQKPPSDDELVTAGDIRKTKEEVLAETRQEVQKALQEVAEQRQQLETAQFTSNLVSITDQTLDAVLAEHAETLGKVPYVDAIIKKVAWADFKPSNVEEVKAALIAAGKKVAGLIAVKDLESKKVQAVAKAKLAKGIEPAGGAAPAQQAKTYTKDNGKADWDALDADVVAWISGGGGRRM